MANFSVPLDNSTIDIYLCFYWANLSSVLLLKLFVKVTMSVAKSS